MINKKEEYIYCEIEEFNIDDRVYLSLPDWLNFVKDYKSVKIIKDSSGKNILYNQIENKDRKKIIRSNILEYIGNGMAIFAAITFLQLIVLNYSDKTNIFNNEYNFNTFLFSGITSWCLKYYNDVGNFTIKNDWFAPGILYSGDYYYQPICYVTFFENLKSQDNLNCKNNFNKFRKNFYDYLK